jgi:hypothetical protein
MLYLWIMLVAHDTAKSFSNAFFHFNIFKYRLNLLGVCSYKLLQVRIFKLRSLVFCFVFVFALFQSFVSHCINDYAVSICVIFLFL